MAATPAIGVATFLQLQGFGAGVGRVAGLLRRRRQHCTEARHLLQHRVARSGPQRGVVSPVRHDRGARGSPLCVKGVQSAGHQPP